MTDRTGSLPDALEATLDASARARLLDMAGEIRDDPVRVRVLHPSAARVVARGPLVPADHDGVYGPTLDDAVREVLVGALGDALADDRPRLVEETSDLYRYGDADEKRAVLRALPVLDIGDLALPLVADALRTNDVRLVAAALGPYGGRHLDDQAWRQGVLKCLFVGVPLTAVARLDARRDEELARMVAAYCYERVAAGRDVPDDVWLVLAGHVEVLDDYPLHDELESEYADRRAAAARFLDSRRTSSSSGSTASSADNNSREA
jgi:hypothetical protein